MSHSKITLIEKSIRRRIDERPDPADPWVRISIEEIAIELAITPQAVNKHIRKLIDDEVFLRERRYYFSENPVSEKNAGFSETKLRLSRGENRFLRNQTEVSENETSVSQKPKTDFQKPFDSQQDGFSETEFGFLETTNLNLKNEFKFKTKIENEKKVSLSDNESSNAQLILPGLVRQGLPPDATQVEHWVDWNHPKTKFCIAVIHRIFPHTRYEGWSYNLTKRGAFGQLAILPGFLEDDLKKVLSFIRMREHAVREWRTTEPGFRKSDKPPNDNPWVLFASHVKRHFISVGIAWAPCEPDRQERAAAAASAEREKQFKQGRFLEFADEPVYDVPVDRRHLTAEPLTGECGRRIVPKDERDEFSRELEKRLGGTPWKVPEKQPQQ